MQLLKIAQVAKVLQCTERTVRNMIQQGQLRAVRLGGDRGDYRIDPEEISRFLSEGKPPDED